ncbi:unnamed protein product [Rotaria magnacalcarata]|uniref:Uncharacterized protein n=1 Tax=Rotaria magnacalcarata TaxID=392030 RepID=A0A816X8R8_9BILA|nr:unnamed protein product [Rotaria magnacalcarata]CAF5096746.1 unnamed protein product [Rotaria magnacalcarata]
MTYVIYLIFLQVAVATLELNLFNTDWESSSENARVLRHDFLRVAASSEVANINRELVSYCMGELPSKFHIDTNNVFPKFTFEELSKQNMANEQLYLWSPPIDFVEYYQYYLNQLPTSNNLSVAKQFLYNCIDTLPRFGSTCQYELVYHHKKHLSLCDIIHDFTMQL